MAIHEIALLWSHGPVAGRIEIVHGNLQRLTAPDPASSIDGAQFHLDMAAAPRLQIGITDAQVAPGAGATLVQIHCDKSPVTFFLRDVHSQTPIQIPEYGLVVTGGEDLRTYAEIDATLRRQEQRTAQQQWESEPEETCTAAAARNRNLRCPTWLTVARDLRIFRVHYKEDSGYWGSIQPVYHSQPCSLPETDHQPYSLIFHIGPGAGCEVVITRRLEDGVLPILHSTQREGDVTYQLTAFATLEQQPLSTPAVRGSAWPGAYAVTGGCMYTEAEKTALRSDIERETHGREQELICCVRVVATNTGSVPRYAWLKAARMTAPKNFPKNHQYDGHSGFASIAADRIYAVHRLNGAPLPQEEVAVLLQPGSTVTLDMLLPHQPISQPRAKKLATLDVDSHREACCRFWREKLASAALMRVPELAIDERIRAGLLHLDINTLGQEPDGSAMACVGAYAPIGSESAPMIQYFDSIGWHRLAERCLQFFFDRQRADGFIQNFGGYQLETGPVLWSAGEHYRYTHDDAWARRVRNNIVKACDYLLNWRERNKTEELRGCGYGLIEGKVADPEDFYHSFMLNGLSYLGLARAAEMLSTVDPLYAQRLAREATAFREDIRTAYYQALARSPVVPLGDGTWVPSPPAWPENRGALSLYAEAGNWFTHGSFSARDSLIGSLWLVIGEVLEPGELAATYLLKSHQELMTHHNAGLSQPYYCRHDYMHLKRGEVSAFLKTYYNQFTALQDRETYSFWEHYFFASQHKTHEEGWFLMQTRWMLFLEEGQCLSLLKGIPRRWLEDGQRIVLENVATYFGRLSLTAVSLLRENRIEATINCSGERRPQQLSIRLPHPRNQRPIKVTGGSYDTATETITISQFEGAARVVLNF